VTRHSAEEWKTRALYEEARRRHVEDELVRIRDQINGILLAAARDEGLDRVAGGAMPGGGDIDRDLVSVGMLARPRSPSLPTHRATMQDPRSAETTGFEPVRELNTP
jgi:hypothetical protein